MRRRSTPGITTASLPADDGLTGVDSLRRGLEILRSLRPIDKSVSVQETATRIGIARTTTGRLMDTLAAHGFLRPLAGTERYEPDVSCLVLGHALRASLPLLDTARPIMQSLADRVDANVVLAVRDRLEMLVLEAVEGRTPAGDAFGAGSLLPMASTSIGRAFLWAQPGATQGEIVERLRADSANARALPGLYRAFQEMEESGYCLTVGEWRRDVSSIGTAILLDSGPVALGVKTSGLGARERWLRETVAPALLEAARELRIRAARR